MLDQLDHRKLGERLDLFHFQEEAPGMAFWHPNGFFLYRKLEEAVRKHCEAQGYREVRTPQILRRSIWERSGHWSHFHQGMFHIIGAEPEAAVKPVSCPGHIQILQRDVISWRQLPIRLAEFGLVHRDEPGGTLHGLMRLQQFTQDDGHIFCRMEQAKEEVIRFVQAVSAFYAKFGFLHIEVALSLRPADRAGTDEQWDQSENALRNALVASGLHFREQAGAGAFYGPKIEFVLRDRQGRDWQCGTIQFDLVMPERFDLRYTDASGERKHCVMLHRALYGSLERFLGILLEHYGAFLPAWLCPLQIRVLPVSKDVEEQAVQWKERLCAMGLRIDIDLRKESLARRIAESSEQGVPYVLVLGQRELQQGKITLREADGNQFVLAMDDVIAEIKSRCSEP